MLKTTITNDYDVLG